MSSALWWNLDGPRAVAHRAAAPNHELSRYAICCAIGDGVRNFVEILWFSQLWCRERLIDAVSVTSGLHKNGFNVKNWSSYEIFLSICKYWLFILAVKLATDAMGGLLSFFYSKNGENMDLTHVASLTQIVERKTLSDIFGGYISWNNFRWRIHRRAPIDATIIRTGKNGV